MTPAALHSLVVAGELAVAELRELELTKLIERDRKAIELECAKLDEKRVMIEALPLPTVNLNPNGAPGVFEQCNPFPNGRFS